MGRRTSLQVVILCGGLGTRLREETEFKPKPLVRVGSMPILWHIMKTYARFGHREFILCLGYRGHLIKEFFLNYPLMSSDFTLHLKSRRSELPPRAKVEDWTITFAETGDGTPTGGRLALVRPYLRGDEFFMTYGDGLADIDLRALLSHHRSKGRTATLTAVHPASPFGVVEARQGLARSFKEKPRLEGQINGGFFVFSPRIFDHLREDSVLEEKPLRELAGRGQLAVYEHRGFWSCMDTFKDVERLNRMWAAGTRPWVTWE